MIITTPIIFNNVQNYRINKLCKKNHKPFVEREGDWICNNCKNLNFAFRTECNRCKLKKNSCVKEEDKKIIKNEDNDNIKSKQDNNDCNDRNYEKYDNKKYEDSK